MLINPNVAFIVLFIALVLLCLGFLIAAFVSALRRKTEAAFWEVLRSMIFDPVFDAALVTVVALTMANQLDLMFASAVTFVGYKLAAAQIAIKNNGDFRFAWFEDSFFNKWAAAFISTKSVVALLAIGVFWLAAYKGVYAGPVMERIVEIVGAWGAANGVPLLTMLKGKDLSFLTPVPQAKPAPLPAPAPYNPAPTPPAPAPEPAPNPYPNRPPFVDFIVEVWDMMFKAYFAAHPDIDMSVGSNNADVIDTISAGQIVWYPKQLIAYANWRYEKFHSEFTADFGFPYEEAEQHWGDKKLVGSCPATSAMTFKMKIPESLHEVYERFEKELSRYNNFAISVNGLGMSYIESVLAKGQYSYNQAFYQVALDPKHFS